MLLRSRVLYFSLARGVVLIGEIFFMSVTPDTLVVLLDVD